MDPKPHTKRGKRAGKRGNDFRRSVKVDARRLESNETTSSVVANGKGGKNAYTPAMYDCYEGVESAETHIIPRESYTLSHHLKAFPQDLEVRIVESRQHDLTTATVHTEKVIRKVWDGKSARLIDVEVEVSSSRTHGDPIVVGNEKVVWKSDKNLLKRGLPDQLKDIDFYRVASRSKRKIYEPEQDAIKEVNIEHNTGMSFQPDPDAD